MKSGSMKNPRCLRLILFSALVAFLAHTVEEYIAALYKVDHVIIWLSDHLSVNAAVVYFVIQALVILLVIVLLIGISRNKIYKPLTILLGLVFLVELSHPYQSLKTLAYYPGLFSGLVIVVIGYFYWRALILRRDN